MSKLKRPELFRILSQPLGKKISQDLVEGWAASFWHATKKENTHPNGTFTMMLPPPNITGNLHLGHALTVAVQDALIRYNRMQGRRSLWIPGFDHAGLATQNIVERLVWTKEKLTRKQMGREKFLAAASDWKELKRNQMKDQLNRLGLDLEWDREYFTIDEKSSFAVQEAFKRLFDSGIIYRAERPIHWSNQLQTTLSDIEVEKIDGVDRYIRTGEVVETRSIPQWFISADKMARRAVEVVNNSSIQMIPPNYKNSWSSWLLDNGVRDWCISRQSWWGHRIPAYKSRSGPDVRESWVVADNLEEASLKLEQPIDDLLQDSDVLDTWFSSSLLPLTVAGWPNEDQFAASCKNGVYPLDIMETGFDILTYWVSKMVMVCTALEDKVPFKLILLHGMICDSRGKKMSKSKGNVIDPMDVIEGATLDSLQQRTRKLKDEGILEEQQLDTALTNQKQLFPNGIPACGADGLRAYLLSHDILEEVVKVQISQIEKIRRLSNKIWNIYRYFISIIEGLDPELIKDLNLDVNGVKSSQLNADDEKVLKDLEECERAVKESFEETFLLHHALFRLELFWIVDLSTDYMGKIKQPVSGLDGPVVQMLKLKVMLKCLSTASRLCYPFMPHLTEFLHQKLATTLKSSQAEDISDLVPLGCAR